MGNTAVELQALLQSRRSAQSPLRHMAFNAIPADHFGIADHRCFLQYTVNIGELESLQVISDPDGILGRQIGNGLWTAATKLVDFLKSKPEALLHDRTVLELGAGIGLVGQVSMHVACLSVLQRVCASTGIGC